MLDLRVLQVYPSRITLTNKRKPLEFHKTKFNKQCKSFYTTQQTQAVENFKQDKNPFIISKASKKKIFDSINSMYALSPKRTITMRNKKELYNFKLSFVTLTLPAKQVHSDIEIKKLCLNQFLVELRKYYNVNNYLWKAELQQNKNIHFHLILDQYVDFQALRRRWNRILEKLGYISAYRDKFKNMNLTQYHEMRNQKASCSFEKSKAAFAAGKQSNWSNPNSVDVRSVLNKRNLAGYLGKYISKNVSSDEVDENTKFRQLSFGRSWFRSYSLSSLKYVNKYLACEMQELIKYLRSKKDVVLEITHDFFTAFYFSAEKLDKSFQDFLNRFLINNAKLYNYPIPIP